jgi:hypothetical protein
MTPACPWRANGATGVQPAAPHPMALNAANKNPSTTTSTQPGTSLFGAAKCGIAIGGFVASNAFLIGKVKKVGGVISEGTREREKTRPKGQWPSSAMSPGSGPSLRLRQMRASSETWAWIAAGLFALLAVVDGPNLRTLVPAVATLCFTLLALIQSAKKPKNV